MNDLLKHLFQKHQNDTTGLRIEDCMYILENEEQFNYGEEVSFYRDVMDYRDYLEMGAE